MIRRSKYFPAFFVSRNHAENTKKGWLDVILNDFKWLELSSSSACVQPYGRHVSLLTFGDNRLRMPEDLAQSVYGKDWDRLAGKVEPTKDEGFRFGKAQIAFGYPKKWTFWLGYSWWIRKKSSNGQQSNPPKADQGLGARGHWKLLAHCFSFISLQVQLLRGALYCFHGSTFAHSR